MSNGFEDFLQQPSSTWAQRTAAPRPAANEAEAVGSGAYKAYGFTPTDDLETCDVAWWLNGAVPQGQTFQYRFLVRIGYLGDDELHLMLTDCVLHIVGKGLRDLRAKLARRKVTFVQTYHPTIWPVQPPPNEPIVERVQLWFPGEKVIERQQHR
jgi:hypothetical protein